MAETDKVLYYYCSTQTFESIIKNKEFWLSDVRKSNDYAEIDHFLKKLKSSLSKKLDTQITEKEKYYYLKAEKEIDSIDIRGYFWAMCFTSLEDDLPQWRAYGQDGKGFSIGINCRQLEACKQAFDAGKLVNLKGVSYETSALNAQINELTSKLESIIKAAPYPANNSHQKYILPEIHQWAHEVVIAAPYFKTRGFSAEKETRLCYSRITTVEQMKNIKDSSHLNYVSFRTTDDDCISYMKFPINKFPDLITSVTIGPKNNTNKDMVKLMFAMYELNPSIDVRKSKLTYRGR